MEQNSFNCSYRRSLPDLIVAISGRKLVFQADDYTLPAGAVNEPCILGIISDTLSTSVFYAYILISAVLSQFLLKKSCIFKIMQKKASLIISELF